MVARTQRRIDSADVPGKWEELVAEVRQGAEVIVTEDGKPVVDLRPWTLTSREDTRSIEKAWESFDAVTKDICDAFADIPQEEIDREIEKAIEEVRAERRRSEAAASLWMTMQGMSSAFADVPPDELQREIDDAVTGVWAERRTRREGVATTTPRHGV